MAVSVIKQAVLCALSLWLLASPVQAHLVDGGWCAENGRSLYVDGMKIRIPSGTRIFGEYSMHVYRYVGPAGDLEAGHDVRMFLEDDDLLHVRRYVDGVPRPEETWSRCDLVT